MHYKNGRAAKNGDKVVCLSTMWKGGPTPETMTAKGAPVVGILYDAEAGNDHCNGRLAQTSPSDACPDLKECLHLDDVLAAVSADLKCATFIPGVERKADGTLVSTDPIPDSTDQDQD